MNDTFNSLTNRLRNPFFFSFAITWLVYNWEIFIILFFENQESIKNSGVGNKLQAVACYYSSANSTTTFWGPLVWTLVYVLFINPLLFSLRNYFKFGFKKYTDHYIVTSNNLKSTSLPSEVLFAERKKYEKKIKELTNYIQMEIKPDEAVIRLKNELEESKRRIVNIESALVNHQRLFDSTRLNGNYIKLYLRNGENEVKSEAILIDSPLIHIVDNSEFKHLYRRILLFNCDQNFTSFKMLTETTDSQDANHHFWDMRQLGTGNWEGKEGEYRVKLIYVKDSEIETFHSNVLAFRKMVEGKYLFTID